MTSAAPEFNNRADRLSVFLVFSLALASCHGFTADASDEVFFIAGEKADCVGVMPQKCLRIRSDESADWQLFYGAIDGFEHEAGYRYKLLVKITNVDRPPQDASSRSYRLIEILERQTDVSAAADR